MHIWTTHELKGLLVEDFQLRIEHSSNIKEAMLRDAGISDCGLIPLDESYKEFLAKLRSKGVTGPVIFIAEDTPRVPDEFLYPKNAICFSLQEDDIIKMGMFINFIFRLAQLRAIPDLKPDQQVSFSEGVIDRPVEEPQKIKEVITYMIEKELPLIISLEIDEFGRPVTVRGVCRVRLRDGHLILYQFKPLILIKGLKEGMGMKVLQIKAILSGVSPESRVNKSIRKCYREAGTAAEETEEKTGCLSGETKRGKG